MATVVIKHPRLHAKASARLPPGAHTDRAHRPRTPTAYTDGAAAALGFGIGASRQHGRDRAVTNREPAIPLGTGAALIDR